MSYNITSWKIRHMHLELPLHFDFQRWLRDQPDRDERGYENVGKRWCLESRERIATQRLSDVDWKLSVLGKEIRGFIYKDKLVATAIRHWTGDCSGHLYSSILLPLFREFKGSLDAMIVWEGGDSVIYLSISNGNVEESEVDQCAESHEATIEGSIVYIEDSVAEGKRLTTVEEHTFEDSIEEMKNASPVYYRLFVDRDDQPWPPSTTVRGQSRSSARKR